MTMAASECQYDEANDLFPEKPQEPDSTDCCGTGCTTCVYDIYEQELNVWKRECDKIRRAKLAGHMPIESESIISPYEYHSFGITNIVPENESSSVVTFEIPSARSLGLAVGQHLILRCKNNKSLTRQYTPISESTAEGYFDMLIKIYPEGAMSQYVKTWKIGEVIEWRGPFGDFIYKSNTVSLLLPLFVGFINF
jgi:cytochrome-b5 reductase